MGENAIGRFIGGAWTLVRDRLAPAAFDLVWPRKCEICGGEADNPDSSICMSCMMRMPLANMHGCAICGRDIGEQRHDNLLCSDCAGAARPHFDRAAFALRFEGDARRLLLDYKFNRKIWLARDFARMMAAAAQRRLPVEAIDLVCPMPVTLLHRLDRGYNQCWYLADLVARSFGIECRSDIVRRAGRPRRQAGLSEKERRQNVVGTFAIRKKRAVVGRNILIIDDVMTTGATMSECARALKLAGARRVYALALAKAVK